MSINYGSTIVENVMGQPSRKITYPDGTTFKEWNGVQEYSSPQGGIVTIKNIDGIEQFYLHSPNVRRLEACLRKASLN